MSNWRNATLDDLVRLQRGHDLPISERRSGEIPVVGAGGPSGFHDIACAKGPGVVLGRAGASMGKATYCPSSFWPLNTSLFVTDFLGNDPRFAFYLLSQIDFSGYNSGAVQPMLNRNYIKQIRIRIPAVNEQRRISRCLGALDDKIAVNDRIATCLLAIADAHFDLAVAHVLPGPETFGSVAQVGGGGTPRTKVAEYWNGEIPWATPSDVTALKAPYLFDTTRKITDSGLDECASVLYPAGSVFMTSRATIGAFAIPQVPTAVNQGFIVVNSPASETNIWLFHEMKSRVDEMSSLANGSTFLELSRKDFKAMEVRLPSSSAIRAFAEKVIPLHHKAVAVSAENSTLTELRDALLPELMSGRLRVKDAEEIIEEAV